MRPQDFIRKRLLGFPQIVSLLINRMVKNLSIELSNFFNSIGSYQSCSKQALSQARKKLKHTAFIALNDKYVQHFYQSSLVKLYQNQYHIFAVDGSLCQMPESDAIVAHFGCWKNQSNKGMPMGRACVVYDVINQVAVQGVLAPNSRSEQDLFRLIYKQITQLLPRELTKILWLMDRAYPSYDLCASLSVSGGSFVIRCRKNFCKPVAKFVSSPKVEDLITLSPQIWYTKKGVKKQSKHTQTLTLRIVRIQLPGNQEEYLLTNLEAPIEELKKLYGMRWGVETYYDYLKNTLELENFSAQSVEGVLQDYHVALLTGNLINLLVVEAQRELDQQTKTGT